MSIDKPQNGTELETLLMEKMDRILADEGAPSGFLDDYFLSEDIDLGLPAWAASSFGKGKKAALPLRRRDDGEGTLGGGSGISPTQQLETLSPPITNRGVSKYKAKTPTPLQHGGYDGGIEVGFEGHWNQDLFSELLIKLEAAKNQAAEISQSVMVEIGGKPVLVEPTGANAGLHYKYHFTLSNVKFFIHHNPPKNRQAVRVRYGANVLIQHRLFDAHAAVLEFLSSLGFIVTEEKISRVDMQVMIDCPLEKLVRPILSGHAVAKARRFHFHGQSKKIETYTLGQAGRLELCIYNKRTELEKSMVSDPTKAELTIRHGVGEEWFVSDRPITRIEFRLWRDVLREMNINTVLDLQERETALADWLTSHWFRILSKQKVRGHENTASLHPLWIDVQKAFQEWFPGVGEENKPMEWSKREWVSCDPAALEKQTAGCLASDCALRFGVPVSIEETRKNVYSVVERFIPLIFAKSVERAKRMGIMKGVKLGMRDACDLSGVREHWKLKLLSSANRAIRAVKTIFTFAVDCIRKPIRILVL
jgi:hypothetical protein